MHQEIDHFGVSIRCGDDLQQTQVTRRVKEVSAAKMFFKIIAPSFCHHVDRDPRRIGSDERAWFAKLFNLIKNLFFDVEPFYHHLNDPIAARDILHVIIKIAGGDALHYVFGVNRRRIAFNGSSQCVIHDLILIAAFRRNVKQ